MLTRSPLVQHCDIHLDLPLVGAVLWSPEGQEEGLREGSVCNAVISIAEVCGVCGLVEQKRVFGHRD